MSTSDGEKGAAMTMNCTEAVILAELARPLETNVELSADYHEWYAQAFIAGFIFFRHRSRVRIQALYFNGLKLFDDRVKTKKGK
jgi:hypothetical protein